MLEQVDYPAPLAAANKMLRSLLEEDELMVRASSFIGHRSCDDHGINVIMLDKGVDIVCPKNHNGMNQQKVLCYDGQGRYVRLVAGGS